MAKTTIKGQFATGADAATVHHISDARRQWLDREIGKATAEPEVVLTVVRPKTGIYKSLDAKKLSPQAKRNGSKRSAKTVRLPAKTK